MKKITREFVAKKVWAEFLNHKNSSIIRLRYMLLFCMLRGWYKGPMPSDPGTGAANTPDLQAFDEELKELLRGGSDESQQKSSLPKRVPETVSEETKAGGVEEDIFS